MFHSSSLPSFNLALAMSSRAEVCTLRTALGLAPSLDVNESWRGAPVGAGAIGARCVACVMCVSPNPCGGALRACCAPVSGVGGVVPSLGGVLTPPSVAR